MRRKGEESFQVFESKGAANGGGEVEAVEVAGASCVFELMFREEEGFESKTVYAAGPEESDVAEEELFVADRDCGEVVLVVLGVEIPVSCELF